MKIVVRTPCEKALAWLWVIACILGIFLVVPLARGIQAIVARTIGRAAFGYLVLAAVAAAGAGLLYALIVRLKVRSLSNYAWLAAVAGLYVYFTLERWEAPEEAVHFLEYGLLGYFLFRALGLGIRDKSIYPVGFLLGSLVGLFDEILQWAMPGRYWDIRDVALNALSSGLIQVALWKGLKPAVISEKMTPTSVRRISALLAANAVLIGLCYLNTPQSVRSYTKVFPALSFLANEEAMGERKHVIRAPGIGTFYSRLTADELENEDSAHSVKNARLLDEWRDKTYDQFLNHFTSSLTPFLYEMRVHIFRRDRRLEDAGKAEDPDARRAALLIAYKENQLLETYFGRTLRKSAYPWDGNRTKAIASEIDANGAYTSPVSAGGLGFWGALSERTLWTGILLAGICLVVLNAVVAKKTKSGRFAGE